MTGIGSLPRESGPTFDLAAGSDPEPLPVAHLLYRPREALPIVGEGCGLSAYSRLPWVDVSSEGAPCDTAAETASYG